MQNQHRVSVYGAANDLAACPEAQSGRLQLLHAC